MSARAKQTETATALDDVFERLAASPFRRRFTLDAKDLAYFKRNGRAAMLKHASEFVAKRLAEAEPKNDGKQTPMRGHPVFVAQHATATCCRNCLAKWHGMKKGAALDPAQQSYIVSVIGRWLDTQSAS